MAVVGIRNLCTPAYVYLVISLIIGIIIYYNETYNNINIDCMGLAQCEPIYYKELYTIIKVIGIIFWTWILNIICSSGSTNIAWALVIFPFLLLFILITMFLMG